MIEKLIEFSLRNRFFVIFAGVVLVFGGIFAMNNIKLDAIPDLSDVQVIIFTEFPGQSPQVVEDQVTYPLTTTMLSVPYSKVVRGYSFFGLSFVYIIFEDGTDLYWARSRVLEYLDFASTRLPKGVTPTLGPDATGVGWIFEYTLEDESGNYDLAQLRSIQDWFLRYELISVPGVAEVASIGGFVKQYQVALDPNKLVAYGIPLSRVKKKIKESNSDVGGRLVEMSETEYMVLGLGYIKDLEDLKNIPLAVNENGVPILLKQVADISLGPELRRGIAEKNGEGEVVAGIVVMRYGENALKVINAVKEKITSLQAGLPEGVKIVSVYDRSGLIERAIDTLKHKLFEEMIVVSLVCVAFLLHFLSSVVAIVVLPLAILVAFIIMYILDINANIMSLSGIAITIGVMVDASVVLVENMHKNRERYAGEKSQFEITLLSAKEVGPALFFSLLIITVGFLSLFVLEEQSGRLFKPLAYTTTAAIAGSAFLSVTFIPVLMYYLIRGKIMEEEKILSNRIPIRLYRPVIHSVLKRKKLTILIAFAVLALTLIPITRLGSEFMPPLNEGDLLYMPTTDPGISITKARELLQQTDKLIKTVPEVDTVFGKIGRAETATDPAPLSMIETVIQLKPESEWRPGMTQKKLIEELNQIVKIPGLTNAWTMPIKTRIDMLSTGIKTPVGIKVMGDDLGQLARIAEQIAAQMTKLPGTLSAYAEKTVGGNYLKFRINRPEAARYGLTVQDVQDVIMSAIGGMNVAFTVEGLERYPINVRYQREFRDNLSSLRRVLISTPSGAQIPISQVTEIEITKGPPGIKSENARRTAWIYVDLHGIDVGTYVKRAQKMVAEKIELPKGYSIVWSGQFEYMERAAKRIRIAIIATVVIIFLLLFIHFRSWSNCLIVMLALPFGLVGGIWLIYILGYHMSVAINVGFIALMGLAAEIGVIMIVYLNQAFRERKAQGLLNSESDVTEAIVNGAVKRVRPILMTACVNIIGLMPIMIADTTGSQVMKRIAAPMVGGMFSVTLLSLLLIPLIYAMIETHRLGSGAETPSNMGKVPIQEM